MFAFHPLSSVTLTVSDCVNPRLLFLFIFCSLLLPTLSSSSFFRCFLVPSPSSSRHLLLVLVSSRAVVWPASVCSPSVWLSSSSAVLIMCCPLFTPLSVEEEASHTKTKNSHLWMFTLIWNHVNNVLLFSHLRLVVLQQSDLSMLFFFSLFYITATLILFLLTSSRGAHFLFFIGFILAFIDRCSLSFTCILYLIDLSVVANCLKSHCTPAVNSMEGAVWIQCIITVSFLV